MRPGHIRQGVAGKEKDGGKREANNGKAFGISTSAECRLDYLWSVRQKKS